MVYLMNPIDQKFSDDFKSFVLQQNNMPLVNPDARPPKPFNIEPTDKSKKTKKDLQKQKDKEKLKDQEKQD